MTVQPNSYFTIGGVQYPLTASLSNSLLQDADPVLFNMLAYFQGVVYLDLASRWNAALTQSGLTNLDGYVISEVLPYPPFQGLAKQNNWKFPLMAVYDTDGGFEFDTRALFHIERNFTILFILPPFNSEQNEWMRPFLTSVRNVLTDRILSAYDSNFNNGELVWYNSGIEQIAINSYTIGDIIPSEKTNLRFPTLTMKIAVQEQRVPDVRNFPNPLIDLELQVSVGAPIFTDGYTVVDTIITLPEE